MTADPQHRRVSDLFQEALALEADQRGAFLQARCGDDPGVRREVEAMLAFDDRAPKFLEPGLLEPGALVLGGAQLRGEDEEATPASVGPFTILGVLGRGGMGVVYRARQSHGVERDVALKVVTGHAAPVQRERFLAESATLAHLDHDHIARLFEAGVTDHGEVWFSMELVDGEPITRFCDARRLSVTERIELLLEVCAGVTHAHQRGVLHRDLKPSNVLVRDVDGRGAAKIIDFGIAKRLRSEDGARTASGQFLGTPSYASPEQALGDADVDVRSDVHALGVLLFHLLTGSVPTEDLRVVGTEDSGAGTTAFEILRRVREDVPPRASTVMSRVAPEWARKVAELRSTRPASLARALRGDLDLVLAQALEKDPARRYASVSELAADLRRHLRSEPVLAAPPGAVYRFRKFAVRNRSALAVVSVAFLGLSTALGLSLDATAEARAAERREADLRRTAERQTEVAQHEARVRSSVLEFLQEVFAQADPALNAEARHQTLVQGFEAALERVHERFADAPDVEQAVRASVAETLLGLGSPEPAARELAAALALDAEPSDPAARLRWRRELGAALLSRSRFEEALECNDALLDEIARAAVETAERKRAEWRFYAESQRGLILHRLGRFEECEQLWRRLLDDLDTHPEFDDLDATNEVRIGLANLLLQRGDVEEAEPLVERALASMGERPVHNELLLSALNSMAAAAFERGDFARAASVFTDVVATYEGVYGGVHAETITARQNLAAIRFRLGEIDAAGEAFAVAITDLEALVGPDAFELIPPLANLAAVRLRQERFAEARPLLERVIALREALSPGADKNLSGFYYDLGKACRGTGDQEGYLANLEKSVDLRIEALGPKHRLVLHRRVERAVGRAQVRRFREAVDELLEIDDSLAPVLGPDHDAVVDSARTLAGSLLALGELERVEPWIQALRARARGRRDEAQMLAFADRVAAELAERR